ncbi:conserved hypothetical protein [Talaromyces stipitatus ATCC 10500]|uniref:Xylanolytic transcriptional activator regulatory domain-containing protein n=1 Tax=Talaromyces stipitatus (strain ATCC 10500 / CBS 375.48 / QM 6759 / NRRL 1006) TaxID=441959 RepID=B8MSL7_TALSN|nr:uncharacterized protein TSTA_003970 [Talaromyces stipitatus ATCC 10500]EED12345.1 conserved hypothetical protein [Talaromyces stipitatus ATCC 10500]
MLQHHAPASSDRLQWNQQTVLLNVGGELDLLVKNVGFERFVVTAQLPYATHAGVKMLILRVVSIQMQKCGYRHKNIQRRGDHKATSGPRSRGDAERRDKSLQEDHLSVHQSSPYERLLPQPFPLSAGTPETGRTLDVPEPVHSIIGNQFSPSLVEKGHQTSPQWQLLPSQLSPNGTQSIRGKDVYHPTVEEEAEEQQYEQISPRVVGSSSAFAFIENVHEALRQPTKRKGVSPHSNEIYDTVSHFGSSLRSNGTQRMPQTVSTLVDDLSLPPSSLVEQLLRKYWDEIHVMNPVFHEQTFMRRRLLNEGPITRPSRTGSLVDVSLLPADRIFQATLNLILAIVCLRTNLGTSSEHRTTQETFFHRAERLLSPDIMQWESLQLVQALVLKAAYLREADMSNQSWIAVGVAIRTAQAIGFGKRAKKTCVARMCDNGQSMTYGRPPMIYGEPTVSHPEAIDDEYLSMDSKEQDGAQPIDQPSRMAFFIHALHLSDISSRIRQLLYGPRQELNRERHCRLSKKPYAEIIDLDADLGNWNEKVPSYLRNEDFTPNHHRSCFSRQRIYLRCQFLHWRLILFRGLLVDFARESSSGCHDSSKTPLQDILSRGSVEICIRTARKLLDTIEPHLGTDRLPAGWFIASFHLYNIGAIIALALLSPGLRALSSDLTLQDLRQAWRQCINCLQKCDSLGMRFAQGCIIKLRKLFEENEGGEQNQPNMSVSWKASYAQQPIPLGPDPVVSIIDGDNGRESLPNGGQPAEPLGFVSQQEPFQSENPGDMENGIVDMWWMDQDFQWMSGFDLSHLTDLEVPSPRDFA